MLIYLLLLLSIVVPEGLGDGYRQCTCAEQTECFAELINDTEICFVQACDEIKSDLIKEHVDPDKTAPCFVQFQTFVTDWLKCVDEQLARESSCLAYKPSDDAQSSYNDFMKILVKAVSENVAKRMDYLYGLDNHTLVKLDQKWHDLTKFCAFDRALKMTCFNKCSVKADETAIQKAIDECYKEHDVVKVQQNRCECMKNNVPCGGYGLECYCEKLKCAKVPEK